MWYKLNQMIGVLFLIVVVGGAAVYGLILIIEAPPLVRQEGDGPSKYELQAREDLRRQIQGFEAQQADALERAAEHRRAAIGH